MNSIINTANAKEAEEVKEADVINVAAMTT